MLMIRILTVIGLFWAPTGGGPGGQEALNRDKTQTQRKLKYLGPPASMNWFHYARSINDQLDQLDNDLKGKPLNPGDSS